MQGVSSYLNTPHMIPLYSCCYVLIGLPHKVTQPTIPLCKNYDPSKSSIANRVLSASEIEVISCFEKRNKLEAEANSFLPSEQPKRALSSDSDSNRFSTKFNPSVQKWFSSVTNHSLPCTDATDIDCPLLMSECYEWMWHLGLLGLDPLTVLPAEAAEKRKSANIPVTHITRDVVAEETMERNVFEDLACDAESPPQSRSSSNDKRLRGAGIATNSSSSFDRVDMKYSPSFITSYLNELNNFLMQIESLIAFSECKIDEGSTFRPSKLKNETEYQAFPINLHSQTMTVQRCLPENSKRNEACYVDVIDSVTCGAPACHGLKFKNGGLSEIEDKLSRTKAVIDRNKRVYFQQLRSHQTKCVSQYSSLYTQLTIMTEQVMNYELAVLELAVRKALCLSQALSIAINAFIIKLELVAQSKISIFYLDRWISHGLLILYESLLSVSGKERGMLEDSVSALGTLQLYTILLLPTPSSARYARGNTWLMENMMFEEDTPPSLDESTSNSIPTYKSSDSCHFDAWWRKVDSSKLDVHIIGRQILILLPDDAIHRLNPNVQSRIISSGVPIQLYPVLFSQGIDFNQYVTSSWDSTSEAGNISNLDLQLQININGFDRLNSYCERVAPTTSSIDRTHADQMTAATANTNSGNTYISSGNGFRDRVKETHPLTTELYTELYGKDHSSKNVEMLREIEGICRMLGGCRVTFCKSGKDRTGMAVTLEQSRLLGERYDCGQSIDRILRDANSMRLFGTRIKITEKNIGRAVYAINKFQMQFLPYLYRPPLEVTEDLIKSTDNT